MAFLPSNLKLNMGLGADEEKVSFISKTEVEASKTTKEILAIILDYTLNKFDDSADRTAQGIPKFLSVIEKSVKAEKELKMCLPAFPFKSANKVYKVFGTLPDKAEELALDRLNTMCLRIGEIYQPGAQLMIISDGLTYNGQLVMHLRSRYLGLWRGASNHGNRKGFTHISFNRIRDLVDIKLPDKLHEITYVANATNFRRNLLKTFGRDDLDIENEIATNQDTLMTYCGYRRFLESDLQYQFPTQKGVLSKNVYKKNVSYLAKEMLRRGYAFAGAVKKAYPDYLRLSIHHSTGEHKISICLLNTMTGYTTPWHCAVARTADGQWTSAPMGEYLNNSKMTIVYEGGRASYFQEQEQEVVSAPEQEVSDACQFCQIIKKASKMTLEEPVKMIAPNPKAAKDGYCQKHLNLSSVGTLC